MSLNQRESKILAERLGERDHLGILPADLDDRGQGIKEKVGIHLRAEQGELRLPVSALQLDATAEVLQAEVEDKPEEQQPGPHQEHGRDKPMGLRAIPLDTEQIGDPQGARKLHRTDDHGGKQAQHKQQAQTPLLPENPPAQWPQCTRDRKPGDRSDQEDQTHHRIREDMGHPDTERQQTEESPATDLHRPEREAKDPSLGRKARPVKATQVIFG